MTLMPLLARADVPPSLITPMTPDVVESYENVRPDADYIKRVVMIPMRDGVKLYTVIFMRKGTAGGSILLSRTPYDAKHSTMRVPSRSLVDVLPLMDAEFVQDHYIRVYQDIRGLHHSEGEFIMNRPIAGPLNSTGIDEATDAYDTIDWLVKSIPESNGKVGVIGSSYQGFTALMAEINPHPALKAAVAESPMVDTWIGDDDFHNGAFRTLMLEYAVRQSATKAASEVQMPLTAGDDYTHFLEAGSTADYARQLGIDGNPYIRKIMQNPAYTRFWSLQAVDKWMAARPLTVPTILLVGQWDQEDSYGSPAVYRALRDKYSDMMSFVIGPWCHSGVNHYGYDLGSLTFTGDTAGEFRTNYMKPFFDHYLKGAADPHTPHVLTYATGINHWEESPHWPMGSPTPLYIGGNYTADFSVPGKKGHDNYVSDPRKPVPFRPRPIVMPPSDLAQWQTWLVQDQRFVSDRPDVLVYKTATLNRPVHIMGAPEVDLFAATSGSDSDWVVKLIDVYPDEAPDAVRPMARSDMAGFELPLGIEIYRGRYVHGLGTPKALTPGKIEEYNFSLPNVDHVFLPGHKIMIQVQSSLFPLYDRNPQTYVTNIFYAKPSDYKTATQSIYYGGNTASNLKLPVVPSGP